MDAARLMSDAETVPFTAIQDHGFDLRAKLGDLLIETRDLKSIQTIRDVFSCVFPGSQTLGDTLQSNWLRLLCERRHLIVHKRGIVDEKYLRDSGEQLQLGCQLEIQPNELNEMLKDCCAAGIELLRAGIDTMRGQRSTGD